MELKSDRVELSTISDALQKHAGDGEPDAVTADGYYSDPAREQRINLLLHLIHYADLLLLSSAKGSGKTSLLANFVERMGSDWQIHTLQGAALVQEMSLSNRLADIFGCGGDSHDDRVQNLLSHIPRLRRLSKPFILVIDDAEKLDLTSMQLLDKILAAGDNYGKPVHLVLAGGPGLDDMLAMPELVGLQGRIAHRLDIPPLSELHTAEFIKTYLEKIGSDKQDLFNSTQIKRIYRRAEGYPGHIIDEIRDFLGKKQTDSGTSKSTLVPPKLDVFDDVKGDAVFKRFYSRFLIFGAIALGVALAVIGVMRLGGDDAVAPDVAELPAMVEPVTAIEPEPLTQIEFDSSVVELLPNSTKSLDSEPAPERTELPAPVAPPASKPAGEDVVADAVEVESVPPIEVVELAASATAPLEEMAPEPQLSPGVAEAEAEEIPAVDVEQAPPIIASAPVETTSPATKRDSWLLQQDPNHFTLQLTAANNEPGVVKFIEENGLLGSAAYFYSERDGDPWYAVTYGTYATRSEANAVVLPPSLRGIKPWVRTYGGIHSAIGAAR